LACACRDLADAFLAGSQLPSDLCQRLLGTAADSVSAREDPPFTFVELTEPVPDQGPALVLGLFELALVYAGVGRREGLLVEGANTVELAATHGGRMDYETEFLTTGSWKLLMRTWKIHESIH